MADPRAGLLTLLDRAETLAAEIGSAAAKGRDPREPGKREKDAAEETLAALLQRHWRRQAKRIRERLMRAGVTKADPMRDFLDAQFDEAFWQEEQDALIADLTAVLTAAAVSGAGLLDVGFDIDYTLTNKEAAAWTRDYAYTLVKDVDSTTRDILRDQIAAFVETPGYTLGDVMAGLPFDEERAFRVAVTEITRAYAEGNQAAGRQLEEEFPDMKVIKIWYTNYDKRVCAICAPLNGKETPLDWGWGAEGEADREGLMNPPAHVNCRCWTTTTTNIAA